MTNEVLLQSMEKYLEGKVAYHCANFQVYLDNPAGIGEHPDIMEAMESELSKIAEYDEKLTTLKKFF